MARNIGGALLPSNSPEILNPMLGDFGKLQVRVLLEADEHGLFYWRTPSNDLTKAAMLATHRNGFSCHELASRIASGDAERVREQVEYILRCGGTAISMDLLPEILPEKV